MSGGIVPDIYRHTARKSTVSRTMKTTSQISKQNGNFDEKSSNSISTNFFSASIKSEEEIPQSSFVFQADNETEQMIVEENVEIVVENLLTSIVETIHSDFTLDRPNNEKTELFQEKTTSAAVENLSTSTPMEITEQTEVSTRNESTSSSCQCQCHGETDKNKEDFLEFEQALLRIRREQEHERSLNSNRLIQTLKRQHDELLNFYHQNKKSTKPLTINRVDRGQQTIKKVLNDCQVQTDISPQSNSPSLISHKTLSSPGSNSTTNHNLPSTRTTNPFQNSSLTTNVRNRPTMTNGAHQKSSNSSTNNPVNGNSTHDIVDLTEEDEEEETNRNSTRPMTLNRQMSATSTASSSSSATIASRIRSNSRATRSPSNANLSSQTFPIRPLPEHNPSDPRIARPQLSITQENGTVRLTWNLVSTPMESIQNYEIYAYKQNAAVTSSDWKKIGSVKSMRLPMAVTLKEFQANSHYAFAVRAISIDNGIGPFCEPKTIFTGNNPIQPLHTSQLLNVPT